ncbi:hypothetical protein NC653_040948 [Populus alba x Populus x berolinensis]|uniref:ATP-dependent DNA helicase n=1 Tax=Populus alba x Populus x berolinensis TaxID=444605 RepID=A0AAD6PQ69_9ROSI|nr:hypothetical protein NC653_040948 [Populus alba x Populus x berolinensis]
MASPHGHVQPDDYVPSSLYSQFLFNNYETPVDRILLSDNASSSNTPSAPQHTQGVGTLVCSRQHIDIQTAFSLSRNIVQTESNEINAASLSNPPQSAALASLHCDDIVSNHESEGFSEETLNHQSTIGQASYQKKKKRRYLIEYIDFGDKTYKCSHCNALFWLQERLARSAKTNPCFTLCCNNGKVVLPAPQETPNYLDNLLNPNNGSSSKKFRREIRAYNSMFAFTSMGAVVDHSVNSRPGSYLFKVNGYCHHLMGSLLPMDNKDPKFAQLYIFDTDNEVSNRLQPFCNENFQSMLDSQIVVGLINILDSSNQLVRLFRHARQRFGDVEVPEFKLRLIGKRDDDSRQYDDPSLNDIGGLVVRDIGHCRSDRDIIIESLSGTLQRISKLHPKFMSLHYPLLFPYGEDGFHTDIPLAHQEQQPPKKRQKVSMRAYYAYFIHEREKQESTLIKGGRLYQQFLVDAFVNVEEERLDFIRANQENLRSEHYKGIHDAITRGDIDGSTTGKIILPSSLTGSPRYMVNNYQDAMAICRCYGNPDLFITFTCNVNWPEIRREIKKTRSYQPEDKPDIIARVFHSKLIDMMSFIKSGKPFGRTIADVCAVEFQKRGLPHTHLLVWLAPEFKFHSPEDVDSIISAEIPDRHQDPICYDIVSKFMMHGPCGAANPKAQCNQSLSSVLRRPGIHKTMLTEWFERNIVDVDARDLFYSQFPSKYVWDAKQKEWIIRSRGFSLGRIVYVHPAAGELYFLIMLLNHVRGAKSFEDLRQISGTMFPTFQLACKALGLLGDDKEWSDAFSEAIPTASSPQLRQIFVNIIMFCEVADPNSLLDHFWHSMHDDIEYHLRSSFSMLNVRLSNDELKNYVLYELEQLFNASGTSLEDHKLPMPNGRLMDEVRNKLLREELDYDLAELRNNHSLAMPLLNPSQRNIYDYVRSEGLIVLVVASSGIASLLLPGGRTAHSRFKIPLEVNESSTCEIKHNTHLSRLLEMTSLIVWDEAPMNNRYCFEALDKSLRDVLKLNNPFGGKSVLLGGDFRQILLVIPGGTKEEIINASFTTSLLWSAFALICDLAVSDDHDASFIKIPSELQVQVTDSPIAAIVSAIYPDIEKAHLDPFYFKDRAIVTPKNLTVSEINNFILDIIPGQKYNFLSCDSIQTTSGDIDNIDLLYPIEFINQLDFNGVPQHNISLKIGTPIMLLRNLSPSAGLCNGTRLIVTQLAERIIEAQIITGSNIGDRVFIP